MINDQLDHKFDNSILRAYDIRGVFNGSLKDNDAYFIGKTFAVYLKNIGKSKVVVCSDCRASSPVLKERLLQGLIGSGLQVIDIGVGPTPMLYFSIQHLNCDAGIMVTGSHNPKDHNGFKIMMKDRPFYGDDIQGLKKILEDNEFYDGQGICSYEEVRLDYVNRLLQDCILRKSSSELLDEVDEFINKPEMKIAWDAGGGAGCEIMSLLQDRIYGEHFMLFDTFDSEFKGHHPDPTVPENLEHLIKTVKKHNCDFGVAYDGDADRIGVVDDEGEIIWGDQLLIFFAREILANNPKATIIADVKASNVLFEEIAKSNGTPLMWKTGHSLIKAKMKETSSPLAGEMSGHIFFADKYYGFDDALYATVRLINILAKSEKKLSQMRKELPKTFSTPEIRIEISEEKKFKIIEELKELLKKNNQQFNDIDGVRATNEFGWWLLRASNTQPVLVARCEANNLQNLSKLKTNLAKILVDYKLQVPQELSEADSSKL